MPKVVSSKFRLISYSVNLSRERRRFPSLVLTITSWRKRGFFWLIAFLFLPVKGLSSWKCKVCVVMAFSFHGQQIFLEWLVWSHKLNLYPTLKKVCKGNYKLPYSHENGDYQDEIGTVCFWDQQSKNSELFYVTAVTWCAIIPMYAIRGCFRSSRPTEFVPEEV